MNIKNADFMTGIVNQMKKGIRKNIVSRQQFKNREGKEVNHKVLDKYQRFITINPNYFIFKNARVVDHILDNVKICEWAMTISLLGYFTLLFNYVILFSC